VAVGIPDFRSPEGLFHELKTQYPGLGSGKDMFHVSVYKDISRKHAFFSLMAKMHIQAVRATPTPFHHLMYTLDARKSLRRVYTQNIDSLESKAGISSGLPHLDGVKPSDITCVQLHGDLVIGYFVVIVWKCPCGQRGTPWSRGEGPCGQVRRDPLANGKGPLGQREGTLGQVGRDLAAK
jgi:hypothetical protein